LKELLAPTKQRPTIIIPTINTTMKQKKRELFAKSLPEHIQKVLNQPYGKTNKDVSFNCVPTLRHVLLPLWWSGF
jgi:hypothetical protein